MTKQTLTTVTGAVWIAAIGSALVLTYALNRPVELADVTREPPARRLDRDPPRQAVEEIRVVSEAEVMPVMVVLAHQRPGLGVSEMMPPDDVVIGPGTVTHLPEESQPAEPVPPGQATPRP